ncbi:interferon regulatory factor 9 isoform 4-T5 [Dama dama]|uniref:interferon regulatory factor 9 isoform X5 n=1 Tax=Dama dama TaxID=30532 RepID=UPI002A366F1B|nr:interferon regulatory factor 9 isoform X5 [Dama dama]
MASGRTRCTRKLRNWVVEQVESGQFPGVCWEDAAKTMFRIPWKHAGKQDFREDQDAAFFKAWAIYKGKYREGSSEGPAIWKTRLRCALNKSCEFEEVPEIGHRDGAEPYKVYRLLPPGTVPAQSGTQKLPSKRPHSSASSENKEEEITAKNCILSPSSLQEPPQNEMVETNGGAGRVDFGSSGSSGSSSSSSSPEPQEGRDTAEALFQGELLSLELLPPPDSDYSLLLTFIYNGRVVGEAQVQSLDCRLLAEPSSSQCSMEQRLCPIPISWNAPQMPPGPGPHLLPSNECVELFRTSYFCRANPPAQSRPGPCTCVVHIPGHSPSSPPSWAKTTEDEAQVEPSTIIAHLRSATTWKRTVITRRLGQVFPGPGAPTQVSSDTEFLGGEP